MAISWTTLTAGKSTEGSIKNLINFSELPTTTILENAQGLIYQFLRVREMLERVEDTFADDAISDSLPARFREAKSIWLIGDNGADKRRLDIHPHDTYEAKLEYDPDVEIPTRRAGTPSFCTVTSTLILLDVKCDEDYPYAMWCYRGGAPLSASVETNFLTDRYPHILTEAIKHFAFDHRQADERADKALKKCMAYIEKANVENDYQNAAMVFELAWER
jgi:hypothetical protein